jgi:hypothetical protein
MATLKILKVKSGLTKEQCAFFLFGYTGDSPEKFPFNSEEHREELWKKYKEKIMDEVYKDIQVRDRYSPSANLLRPREWFLKDATEKKRVFNNAKFLKFNEIGHCIWDMMPLLETDAEFLGRLNLLTSADLLKMASESFQFEEGRDLEFRGYCLRESVQSTGLFT